MVQEKDENASPVSQFAQNLGILPCTFKEAKKVARLSFECGPGHVPVFVSEAGTGKSQVARQLAHEMGARAVFFFLAHIEREDIAGIPFPDEKGTSYRFLCEETIRDIVSSDEPTLLILDEWNRGEKNVMSAAFTMMEDRRFGAHSLPDHVYIMACMNPSEGNYLVNEAEKDPAFRRRLCFIAIQTDPAVWLEYAVGPGKFHPFVTHFIQSSPSSLVDVSARNAGKVYANPASWEKASQTLHTMQRLGMDLDSPENRKMLKYKLGGHIGAGMTENFLRWIEENSILVDPRVILFEYEKVAQKIKNLVKDGRTDLINEACEGVALTLITAEPDPDSIAENIGQFVHDLSAEFAKAFFQKIAKHSQKLNKQEFFTKLSTAFSKVESYRETLQKIHDADARVEEESQKDD